MWQYSFWNYKKNIRLQYNCIFLKNYYYIFSIIILVIFLILIISNDWNKFLSIRIIQKYIIDNRYVYDISSYYI